MRTSCISLAVTLKIVFTFGQNKIICLNYALSLSHNPGSKLNLASVIIQNKRLK